MKPKPIILRCAIYTRKSSDENLDNDFNSLDSQREHCESFIKSQGGLGWLCLPDRYDDGGYSGGTLNRPAFKRLMADAQAGKIDCIVVYKYERLSRSLRDFLDLMERLELLRVTFVSVTQQFNTATSAGRMALNMMVTLAQYERENASERTRDKIAAARRRGKWGGGRPILGYDVDRATKRLVVNAEEAERVRQVFRFYIEHEALLAVVNELSRRGWLNKQWTTTDGTVAAGKVFNKVSLYQLLTNTVYIGLVKHKDQTYPGEHEGIVDEKVFRRVQEVLKRNGRTGGALVRNKHNALLKGLLHCSCCNCSMGHSYSSKSGRVKYRYYLCLHASKNGWNTCPGPSIPAGEVEGFVVDRIRGMADDRRLITETLRQARKESAASKQALVTEHEVVAAFARFDELWATLAPREQVQVIRSLVRRIEWDGRNQQIRIVFHPTGLRGLVDKSRDLQREEAA